MGEYNLKKQFHLKHACNITASGIHEYIKVPGRGAKDAPLSDALINKLKLTLKARKTGVVPDTFRLSNGPDAEWGTRNEPLTLLNIALKTGKRIEKGSLYTNPKEYTEYIGATPDGIYFDENGVAHPVEVKNFISSASLVPLLNQGKCVDLIDDERYSQLYCQCKMLGVNTGIFAISNYTFADKERIKIFEYDITKFPQYSDVETRMSILLATIRSLVN